MSVYNLIEYSDNYSKTSRSLWQYYKDEENDNLTDFEPFKSKIKITGKTPNDVEIIVQLRYLRNFWRTLEMPLINDVCFITNSTDAGIFEITDAKLSALVVTLSTQDNANYFNN